MKPILLFSMLIVLVGMGYGCRIIETDGQAEAFPAEEQRILLMNLHIFDVFSGNIRAAQDIRIEGGRIAAVGKLDDSKESVERIDCSGKYAVPGLCDCHTHLAMLTKKPEAEMKKALHDFVLRGVTHVRDVGGPLGVISDMSKNTASGKFLGPEIFFTGPMLERTPLTWAKHNESLPGFTVAIDSTEDVDRILDDLSRSGACMVKAFNKIDMDVFRHLVAAAERHSLRVVHDPGSPLFHHVPMDKAIELGVTSIEHAKAPWPVVLNDTLKNEHDALMARKAGEPETMAFFFKVCGAGRESVSMDRLQQLIEKMRIKGAFLCPTLQVFSQMAKQEPPESVPEQAKPMWKKTLSGMKRISSFFTTELFKGKVKLLVGQDGIDPKGTFSEMKLLKECGVEESEIIKGATLYPAQWLGVEERIGSLLPGREANIVVLDGNPLEDINNMESIFLLIHKGDIIEE